MFRNLFRRNKNPQGTPEEVQPADAEQIDAPETEILPSSDEAASDAASVAAVDEDEIVLDKPEPEPKPSFAPEIATVAQPEELEAEETTPRRAGFFRRLGTLFSGRKLDDDLLDELEEQMLMGDVSLDTTQKLLSALREAARRGEVPNDEAAQEILRREVAGLLGPPQPLRFNPDGLTVWLFVGVNGVGKTTSVGKLAAGLARGGRKPLLVAGDTFRAAAVEQLQEWGRRANCPVIAQTTGADPAAVVHDALQAAKSRQHDIVLIDTAGRLHTKGNLMNELAKIGRVIEREVGRLPDETLMVLDATTGQNGLVQAQAFTGPVPLTGLILTKMDGTAKGGIILSVAGEAGVPVKMIGVGEKIGDLRPFDPQAFAREMFDAGDGPGDGTDSANETA